MTVGHFLIVACFLFALGIVGALTRKSAITVFLSIELMLNAVNLMLVTLSRFFGHMDGAAFTFFVLAVSASEAAVGLAIVVSFIRKNGTTSIDAANLMKW